ncbi:MAG TPA: heterodisulfide reductase-related iron-sulfur binding cluster [Rhodanobacteraceae bacterium]|nr:heterodisulfide reductase-related iron-sulfur binding cluster [Rhodanobacteraceae bacterium]
MPDETATTREGSLDAPTRHPIEWRDEAFWDQDALDKELERVFNICHGCRRCVSLCHAFPTLFDLIDESATMEIDGVDKADYGKVVEQCYLCDLCYQTKCPYVPPHPWNVDFPHVMLRAKAVDFKKHGADFGSKVLSSTTAVGRIASIPVIAETVNTFNRSKPARKLLDKTLHVHPDARVPEYQHPRGRKRLRKLDGAGDAQPAGRTRGRVAIFATCYCDSVLPTVLEDLVAVLSHNGIATSLVARETCCGMPKLELGDLDSIEKYKNKNIPVLAAAVREGFDLTAAIPSCVLMFKQELPLLFPDDEDVQLVKRAFFDPFEYLMERHKAGLLKTDFGVPLGKVAWHVACHQRVQKIGPKTREILSLVPETEIVTIERCSGHDGTYGVRSETYSLARKIARPVETRIQQSEAPTLTSDCPMAGSHLAHGLDDQPGQIHPVTLLRRAYGI